MECASRKSSAFASSSSPLTSPHIPVGIFVDLDNRRFREHSRSYIIQELVKPLRTTFALKKNDQRLIFRVFANRATQTYLPPQEKERRENNISASPEWDPSASFTGLDEDGVLRCGICGAPMKVTKKNRRNGITTAAQKLDYHMKMLHDREQAKRQRHGKKGNSAKFKRQSQKYRDAQLDVRTSLQKNKNQLFQVLSGEGIKCYSVHDVDKTLINRASEWMKKVLRLSLKNKTNAKPPARPAGILVVVSQDADFCDLLRRAQAKGFLAVSVSQDDDQTAALRKACDIVLTNSGNREPEAVSARGLAFLEEGENQATVRPVFVSEEET